MLEFVFREHLRLAAHGALLFAVGLFISWPAVHYRVRALASPALAVFRFVLRLLGPSPGIAQTTAVIFGFNGFAIFLYMAAGVHPLLPKAFGIWTGANVGMIVGFAREESLLDVHGPAAGQWVPSARLAALCSLVVLLVELPCFWYALALGISMGHEVQSGGVSYLAALALRARAYATMILPLLLLSALAEAVAVRGSRARGR